MAQNAIDDMLDHLRRIKNERHDLNVDKIYQIEKLERQLRFFRTLIKYHQGLLPDSVVVIRRKAQWIARMLYRVFGGMLDECKTNYLKMEMLASHVMQFLEGGNTSLRFNYELDDSFLLEYMDYLDKNLNDVLMCVDYLKILKVNRFFKHVKIIQKKMRFLRYLYATEINGYVDHEKLECLETLIRFMANNVGQFCLAVSVNDENVLDGHEDYICAPEDDILNKPPYLLCLIMLVELEMKKVFFVELKASKFTQSRTFEDKKLPKGFSHHLHSLLMYLGNKKLENFPNNVSAQNIDVAIEFLLIFLVDVSKRVINRKMLNDILVKVGAIAGDVLYVIQKPLPSSISKDKTNKIGLCSMQILEKTKDLKAKMETYYKSLKFTPSRFPTFGGLGFLDSLLRKLNKLLKSKSGLDFIMKPTIGILENELSSLTSTLEKVLSLPSIIRDVEKMHHEHENIKDLHRRTISLAYEAEVAIDSILAQCNTLWHLFCSLPTILKEIKHISVEVSGLRFKNLILREFDVVEPSKHLSTQHSNPVNDEEIVGFDNEAEIIIDYLTRGTNELDVIPIVGMGGQGKTTIVRKVYNNGMIVSHFDCLAWCSISQTYNRKELLQEIFSQVTSSKVKVDEVGELADMLRKSLMCKRYLIVLDDMWDVMAWEDLMLSFPNGENRSRIIVTTRLEKVGEHVMHHTDPYSLPFLTPDESLKLLQKKVFQQERCPPGLYDASQAVAKRCKGLPLVIILVAGIIKRKKMEESWWHEVENALFSYLGESEEYSLLTVQLNYDYLPDHLRPCLLYMGMFPEDTRIPVSKLISLWIAEGFVQNIESGRLEETAEDYLMDLISNSVVLVSKRQYNGKVKYCQVHDVVLHFCLERSREEKFMLAVKGNRSHFPSSRWKESRLSFIFSSELSLGSKTRNPFHRHLRSLITTNPGDYQWNPFRQCSKWRLLKVLDLSSIDVNYLSSTTLKPLIHLKYLAVDTREFDFHPEPHLPHMETLIVENLFKSIALPAIFWKMEKLRHVEVSEAKFDLEYNKQRICSSKLENLRILRRVRFLIHNADNVDVLLRSCPNLQELEIKFRGDKYSKSSVDVLLESLTRLQILSLTIHRSLYVPKLHLPSTLKKLVLRNITESTISAIGRLPSLEYLKLQAKSEEWFRLRDITFHKLKFLKLSYLDISKWDASEESFPLLETLVIRECYELEEIPLSFADIPTLKQIKLIGSRKESLEVSAEQIKETVEDIEGCDRIDLIIRDW